MLYSSLNFAFCRPYIEHVCHSNRARIKFYQLQIIMTKSVPYPEPVFNHFVEPLVFFLCIMALVRLKGSSFSFDSEYRSKFRVKKARTYFYLKNNIDIQLNVHVFCDC